MPRGKKELAEQITPELREVEVEVGRGKTVLESVKKISVTEQTYYRWKKKFGGLRIDQSLNDCVQFTVESSVKVSVSCWFCWPPFAAAAAIFTVSRRCDSCRH